jgi:hypothetical protein
MTHARSLLVLSLLAAAAPTFAYTPTSLTAAEAKCQQSTAKAVGAGWARMTKCQAQCDKSALVGKNPASDCQFPWGGATLACIEKAKTRTRTAITSHCAAGCPTCYDSGGDCDASAHLDQWVANDINMNRPDVADEIFVSFLYDEFACTDQNTLTTHETLCRDAVPVLVGRHVAAFLKCLSRCRYAQFKGELPLSPDPCVPPTAEPTTFACYQAARAKFDAKCQTVCADPPDCGGNVCFGGSNAGNPCTSSAECPSSFCEGPTFSQCFDWEGRAEHSAVYYDRIPPPFPNQGASLVFCPSPSGAFLDDE